MFTGLSAGELFAVFVSLILAMGFHEATHAYVSHALGDTTAKDLGRLTLNPLKHIDIITTILLPLLLIAFGFPPIFAAKPVPFNPDRVKFDEFGAALIGISGPLSNLFLAFVSAIILKIGGFSFDVGQLIVLFMGVNVGLFVFNMLPIPPLDGSRLLYAFAPEPVQKVMYAIEQQGLMFVFLVIILLSPVIGPIIYNISNGIMNFLLLI